MVRPLKRGAAFVARDAQGAVLLVKRPEKGLLGNMMQPPLGPWGEDFPTTAEARSQAPFDAEWRKRTGIVTHGFTHFELEIEVYVAEIAGSPLSSPASRASARRGKGTQATKSERSLTPGSPSPRNAPHCSAGDDSGVWVADLATVALPTVMKKIVAHAFPDDGPLFASGYRRA